MDSLLAARSQMAISLGFHIIFAALGVGLPLLTLIVHRRGRRKRDADALLLAKRWSKVMAVLFAIGAVSGTVLSFEMGMLWPGMMSRFGEVIGLAFSLEGVSFFVEAVFIGIYLYGWKHLPARWHERTLYPMVIAGMAGSYFVLSVNAWMNAPSGFTLAADGSVENVEPLAAIFNWAVLGHWLHMLFAAYMVTGFVVAGIYARAWLKGRRSQMVRLGFLVPFTLAAIATPAQILVGDFVTGRLIEAQPAKFASLEMIPTTQRGAPLTLGGRMVDGEVEGAIEVPYMASFLGTHDFDGEVPGLDSVPADERPSDRLVNIVHWSFQLMVFIGSGLLGLALWFGWSWWRRGEPPESKWFWRAASLSGVGALIAMECGWITTEVGRQPWVVYRLMRTSEAVTHATGLEWSLAAVTALYVVLAATLTIVLLRIARQFQDGERVTTAYGPEEAPAEESDAAEREGN